MNALNFETGIVTFSVNGTCDIAFNPTDSAFAEKLFSAFDVLDKRQEGYKDEISRMADKREIFEFARARDAEMRTVIDEVFGKAVCEELFGGMNVYALSGGLPVWCNFMLAVIEACDTAFAREQKATNPRIQKYVAKYHR